MRDVFFCGLDPKSYCAVLKVLDGFRFPIIRKVGQSCDGVGFWFVPCFAGGILVGDFKAYRIIMYSSGTMKGPRLQGSTTLLRFKGGMLENMRLAKHCFTVKAIVTALYLAEQRSKNIQFIKC